MRKSQTATLEPPLDVADLRMPPALLTRLNDLLDKMQISGRLSTKERKEAEALVDLNDTLGLLRLQAVPRKHRPS